MSADGDRRTDRSAHDPWRIGGSALPPNLLLSAKLLAASLLLQGYVAAIPEPFLPLVPWLRVPRPDAARAALQVGATAAALLLLASWRPRTCALALGAILFLSLLATRGDYRNSKFFVACILILIGLHAGKASLLLLRAQIVLVYLGSGLNKVFEPDWLSGRYFDHWQSVIVRNPVWQVVADRLPPLALGQVFGWGAIASELALGVALAFPPLTGLAIMAAVPLHAGMVAMAGTTFGIFFTALLFAYPVLFRWPARGETRARFDPGRRVHRALRRFAERGDHEGWVTAEAVPGSPLELDLGGRTRSGARAAALWLLLTPATWFVAAVVLAAPAWLHWGAT